MMSVRGVLRGRPLCSFSATLGLPFSPRTERDTSFMRYASSLRSFSATLGLPFSPRVEPTPFFTSNASSFRHAATTAPVFSLQLAAALRTLPVADRGTIVPECSHIQLGQDWFAPPTSDLRRLADAITAKSGTAKHVFVRSTIGSGKSSLLEIAAYGLSFNFKVYTVKPRKVFRDGDRSVGLSDGAAVYLWTNGVSKRVPVSSVDDFLGAVVFVDECHLVFSSNETVSGLIKDAIPSYVLLFSSSAAHRAAGADGNVMGGNVTSWGRRPLSPTSFGSSWRSTGRTCSNFGTSR